jgi:hypothetical protein
VLNGDVPSAVRRVDDTLESAPAGSALWTLPIDPLLRATADQRWAPALSRLRNRAA